MVSAVQEQNACKQNDAHDNHQCDPSYAKSATSDKVIRQKRDRYNTTYNSLARAQRSIAEHPATDHCYQQDQPKSDNYSVLFQIFTSKKVSAVRMNR